MRAFLVCLAVACGGAIGADERFYVDASAAAGGDGASWQTAFRDLQDGLTAARGADGAAEVWVARGVYRPDGGTLDRTRSFGLASGVAVYGGFAGRETELSERDPAANVTVLSGDLLGNDGAGFGGVADNSEHVVTAFGVDATARLDGVTVEGGNADADGGSALTRVGGGGLFCDEASPTVIGCRFRSNTTGYDRPTTGWFGGAVFVRNRFVASRPRFEGCEFEGNRAMSGGAFGLHSIDVVDFEEFSEYDMRFADCGFVGNSAGLQSGGAVFTAGSPLNRDVHQALSFERCAFIANDAQYGGAMLVQNPLHFEMTDCELVGNSASVYAGAIWHTQTNLGDVHPAQFARCVFEGNTASIGVGGGLLLGSTSADLVACSFLGNGAVWGGGVFVGPFVSRCDGRLRVVDSEFSGNSADRGAGAYVQCSSFVLIADSTIAANDARLSAGGVFIGSGVGTVANSVLWGNAAAGRRDEAAQLAHGAGPLAIDYSLVEGLTGGLGGEGNIDGDPRFVDGSGPDGVPGTRDDDLRLGAGSPAIDSGSNGLVPADFADIDGDGDGAEPTPLDRGGGRRFADDPGTPDTGVGGNGQVAVVDMGAHELDPGCAADFNGDGAVNTLDVLAFLNAWNAGDARADFNGDGAVNTLDVLAFLNAWTAGC